jgi:hypothetical protein
MLSVVCPGCSGLLDVEVNGEYLQYISYFCPHCATPVHTVNREDAIKHWSDATAKYNDSIKEGQWYCHDCPFEFFSIVLRKRVCKGCYLRDKTKDSETIDLERWFRHMMPKQVL